MTPPDLFFLSRLLWLFGVFCGSMQILDLFVNCMGILTILIFPGHEYGISFHQSILWQTPICPLYLWVYLLQRCGIAFHLLMPFSAFSVSVFRRLSLRVFTSLLQTPFFLYLSTFTVREIKWRTVIPVYTETTSRSFKKSKFLKTAKSPNKILCEEIYFGISGVERLRNKLYCLGSSAGTSCCGNIRRVSVSTSRKLSCLCMTKHRQGGDPWTHSPNDGSLPEWEEFQGLWETERFPHLFFWNPWFQKQIKSIAFGSLVVSILQF